MTDAGAIITRYIELVGAGDLGPLDDLLADDLRAVTNSTSFSKAEWIAALARLLPVLVRNDIRHVYVDDDDACVMYDFVTDTEAGAVPCVEAISVRDGRIAAVELIFEKANWGHVVTALQERAPASKWQ